MTAGKQRSYLERTMNHDTRPAWKRALREPLLYFMLLAAGLFAVSALVGPGDDVIEVSREELEYRILQVEAEEGAPLTPRERRLVEEAYIDERVLVEEARRLGLQDDERIDDILVQKMLHVLSGDVIQPSDEELALYYESNAERYVRQPSVTVDELVLPSGSPLPASLGNGGAPSELAEDELIGHRVVPDLTLEDLSLIFGEETAQRVFDGEVGAWFEGFESVRGDHWFRVQERSASGLEPFSVVRDQVRLDWIAEQEDRRLLQRVAELRERYTVVVEEASDGS